MLKLFIWMNFQLTSKLLGNEERVKGGERTQHLLQCCTLLTFDPWHGTRLWDTMAEECNWNQLKWRKGKVPTSYNECDNECEWQRPDRDNEETKWKLSLMVSVCKPVKLVVGMMGLRLYLVLGGAWHGISWWAQVPGSWHWPGTSSVPDLASARYSPSQDLSIVLLTSTHTHVRWLLVFISSYQ